MQEAVPLGEGTMSAILGIEDSIVEEVCIEISKAGNLVEPANYNCPGQLVISGTVPGVTAAAEELKNRGAKRCVPLEVSAPFHCSLLRPAGERLAQDLEKVPIQKPKIPYFANVDAACVQDKSGIARRLAEQVYRPVRWSQSLQTIFSDYSPEKVIEVGASKVIGGHVKKIDRSRKCLSTDSLEALNNILSA